MKKAIRVICVFLVVSVLMGVPVCVSANENQRASAYFSVYYLYLEKTSGNHFGIYYDVTGTGIMQEIGVKEIVLYRSQDGVDWEVSCTYRSTIHTNMICKNTGTHDGSFIYCGSAGYRYQAAITIYAKNSNGSATRTVYTNILYL